MEEDLGEKKIPSKRLIPMSNLFDFFFFFFVPKLAVVLLDASVQLKIKLIFTYSQKLLG